MMSEECPTNVRQMSDNKKVVSVIYKVVEVAKMLGFNERTIRRDISSMSEDVRVMSVECPTDVRYMSVTEYGLKWLADKHNITLDRSSADEERAEEQTEKTDTSESEIVLSLLEQLRQKDLQIAEKDKQIAQLMEQAKNFQVLLQAQQVLSLPEPKQSFLKRLFGRKE